MSEKEYITTYSISNPSDIKHMERDAFYQEQIDLGKRGSQPTVAVGIFDVMLFTEKKELILQKRSNKKRHNPYLIDKTVGGHIQFGDTPHYTAMVETVQELRIPSVILRDNEDFKRTYNILNKSLESAAIVELIDNNIYILDNIVDGNRIPIAKNIWMFLGLYSGAMKPVDGEASGILYYELDALKEEMQKMPELFTPDLHFMMKKYEKEFNRILDILN